jgi:FHS family Na+ dependent glucose MFS transporter 1
LEIDLITSNQKRNQTIGYFGAFIILGITISILGPSLPTLAENTGSTIGQISVLFTASSGGYFLGSVLGGRLYDRFAGHIILAILLALMTIGLAVIPFIPLLWVLTATLFLLGVFEGALDVGGNTLLIWVHRREVGPYMNALHFFFGVGAFIAPIILAQTALLSGDIKLGYIFMALMILPVLVWVFRQPSPVAPKDDLEHVDGQALNSRSRVILIAFTAAILFFYVGAEIGFGGWVYTYALELNLANETTAAYLNSAFWGSFTIGRLLSIPLATRFRPRMLMIVNFMGCFLSAIVIILLPGSVIALWSGSILMGLSMASIFPVTITLAERRMTITGQTTGWFFVGVGLGSMLTPLLIGQLFGPVGPLATMYVILAALVLDFLVFLGMLRYSQKLKPI